MRTVISIITLLLVAFLFCGCSGGDNLITPPHEDIDPSEGDSPDDGSGGRHQYNIPDADDYLGGGHPIEGVNYRRNNRSPYMLPDNLDVDDFIAPFSHEESYIAPDNIIDDRRFHTFVVSEDEEIYLGRSLYYYKGFTNEVRGIWESVDTYDLSSICFGDDLGQFYEGGQELILTTRGVISFSHRKARDASYNVGGPPVNESSRVNISFFRRYGIWPEVLAGTDEEWGIVNFTYGYFDFGDWTSRRFADFLPLPDDRILVSFSRDDGLPPNRMQELDNGLEAIQELELPGEITGFAFDGRPGYIYISTSLGLYCYSWFIQEVWDTTSNVPEFSDDIPVITDAGSITGCADGVLKLISQDGVLVSEQICGAVIRPAILNDGTIAVISGSTIKYFDESLNEIGQIPLPGGIGTGVEYSRPPLIDKDDNLVLFTGCDLYIIDRNGDVIAERAFSGEIREIRLGPEHLFVALDYMIYRFPSNE